MNFTYFKFLFINTIKRKPVWITWLLFLLTCTSFLIIVPLAAKMNTLQLWANTTMTICQTFLGMTAALFTSVLAINLFKEGNEEGTELIVVSKPISRFKIILTKFLLFFAFCLIVNISACLISMFTIFLPRTEIRFYWGLIVSMLIGNAISFGIFGSIAIILTVPFAKAGVIITNIVLSLVFLIYQALTLFVFRVPSKAMADQYVTAPSYIVTNRDPDTGEYTEEEVVKFTAAPVQKKDHPCKATNWKEMKSFWENDILGVNPTKVLNATDLAGQVSLTYLSVGIDQYSARQAQRMFAVSRFYDYQLTSPASPEIIEDIPGKKTMPWIYVGSREIPLSDTLSFYIPAEYGFAGIPPITSTRLRGYTHLIPVGYVKSKEILSQREVYLEPEQWIKYKSTFEKMYKNVFDYTNYLGKVTPTQLEQYPTLFAANNDTIALYYELVWDCLTGNSSLITKEESDELEVKNVDDLNDRFIQFKYYCFVRAQEDQQKALNNVNGGQYEEAARATVDADTTWQTLEYALDVKHPTNKWYMQANSNDCLVVEPGTQTISWNLINTVWEQEKADMTAQAVPEEDQIAATLASTKGVVEKTGAIFKFVAYPKEYYLFDSVNQFRRNAKLTGDMHVNIGEWVPYLISKFAPFWKGREEAGVSIATCQPIGQNLQFFYYTTKPVTEYWKYAVIWAVVSLSLFAAGCIVYNKYDFK